MYGRGGEIRTPDILLPKQARYRTALHPESNKDRKEVDHFFKPGIKRQGAYGMGDEGESAFHPGIPD